MPVLSATFDPGTNHQTGQSYDANGNIALAPAYFPYDVENRLTQPPPGGFAGWSYDPKGKRVLAETLKSSSSNTTCEIYFYGITGQKLATYTCNYADQTGGNGSFFITVKSRNLYFGGKLMRSAGVTVVTDRLGSVRANSNGDRMSYFPYGEERTSTADGREKFGTYYRDGAGIDYADQRYYTNASGRFMTPDPYRATPAGNNPSLPASWNRYAYVDGDPINFFDPSGLIASKGEDPCADPDALDCDTGVSDQTTGGGGGGNAPEIAGGGGGEGPEPGPAVDASTNVNARGLLRQRLANFKDSNCWKVLSHEGVKVQNILDNYTSENFYDVRSESQYGSMTLSDIGISSSNSTPLNALLGSADAKTVGTLGTAGATAVLVGSQYFYSGNTDAARMNSLLHEMLHALGGFTDSQILNDSYFLKNGLVNKGYSDTSGVTDWLGHDCMK